MGLFNWFTGRGQNIKEAPKGAQMNPGNIKQFMVKAIGMMSTASGARAGEFSAAEHDLTEIKNAISTDSYIKISIQRYTQLIFKAGYAITSENDAAAEYIRTRFRMMSFATSKPMDILFQEIADDMVKYSNAFLVKSRVASVMGGIQAKGVLMPTPVGGYFRLDPSTIEIKRDKTGTVTGYQQNADNQQKKLNVNDVVHFYMDKEADSAFGTPSMIAALEDVKLLRKLESNVVALVYRFAIPLFQWIIGLPENGLYATDKEIDDAKVEIEKIAPDGTVVTNERTQIKAIGAEGTALQAAPYLKYFESRAFTALNMSEAQMGRGGSKQDSDAMEAIVHNTVKHVQRTARIFIENFVINELLLEGGYNPIVNEQDIVNFVFNETSIETHIKVENHEMLKFQSNLVTFEEARTNIGMRSDTVDESRLYAKMIEQANVMEQIGAKASTATATATTGQGAGKPKSTASKPNGAVVNNNRPKNQHGTGSAKVKEFAESVSEESQKRLKTQKNIEKYRNNFGGIYKTYITMRNDIVDHNEKDDIVMSIAKDSILNEMQKHLSIAISNGAIAAAEEARYTSTDIYSSKNHSSILEETIDKTVKKLFTDIKTKLKNGDDTKEYKRAVFDTMEYRLRFLAEHVIQKAYWYSYVKTCSAMGIDKVHIDFDGSDDKKNYSSIVDTNNFSLDSIPAFHSFCNCKIILKKKAG